MNNYYLYSIVGMKGCGKTTFLEKRILNYKKNVLLYSARPNNTLSLPLLRDVNDLKSGKFKTDERFIDYAEFCLVASSLKDTLIVIDDTYFFENEKLSRVLKKLIINHRGHRCNIILVFHSFYYIPKQLLIYIDCFFAFKTLDAIEKNVSVLPESDKIIAAYKFLSDAPKYSMKIVNVREWK